MTKIESDKLEEIILKTTKKIKDWLSEAIEEVKKEEEKNPLDSETLMYLGGKVVAHKKDLLLILKYVGGDPEEVIKS